MSHALAALVLLAPLAQDPARPLPLGPYHAWLDSPGGNLPFGFELVNDARGRRVVLANGQERIDCAISWRDPELTVELAPYDARLTAKLDAAGTQLDGTWRKRQGADEWTEMPFHARAGEAPRFPWVHEADPTPLAPRWAVQFEQDRYPAVAHFEVAADGTAQGTFLTALGDYRYLEGQCRGELLQLSCFDGAHAFLFTAALQEDGSLRGDFWSSDRWHETWTAHPDATAALPDAETLTKWRGSGGLGDLAYPGLDGKRRRLDDPAFAGKARLIVALGSWCPNCNDEAQLLRELDATYRPRGLSIVGLAFERTGDLATDTAQVARFAAHHKLRFPILIAGLADKEKAAQAFPLLERIVAYPTTIFLRGDGSVRAIHTGYSGPATGEAHAALRAHFIALIEEMLREG